MGREQIKVELMDYMGSDLSTVNSARVSFDKESDWEIDLNWHDSSTGQSSFSKHLKDKDKKLISYLARHNHSTPFRHNQVMLRCKAPIFLARQLGKHQAGLSWNEVSRRYVDEPPEFFIPDEWRARPEGSVKQGSSGVSDWSGGFKEEYRTYLDEVGSLYNAMILRGVAPEQARMVLPQSMMTSWVWSGNLLAFAHVYKERIASNAQLEAQWFAEELDKIIRPLFPVSWTALVGE